MNSNFRCKQELNLTKIYQTEKKNSNQKTIIRKTKPKKLKLRTKIPMICLSTYKPKKKKKKLKKKKKHINFLLHKSELKSINDKWNLQLNPREGKKQKPKFVLDKWGVKQLETLRQECSFKKCKEIEETKNTLCFLPWLKN